MIAIPELKWRHSLLFLICIALLAIAQVGLSFVRNTLSSDLQKQEQQKQRLEEDISRLKLELASIKRPERLRTIAKEQLGMSSPKPYQVLRP